MDDDNDVTVETTSVTTKTVPSYRQWLVDVMCGPIDDHSAGVELEDGWNRTVIGFLPDPMRVSLVFQDTVTATRVLVVIPATALEDDQTDEIYDFVKHVPALLVAAAEQITDHPEVLTP